MSLGAYESEVGRGNLLNALAHPTVVNPAAAIGNAVQTARGVADLRTTQFNLQQAQLAPVYQSMRQLAATNPNPSPDDITAALGGAARIGGNVDGVVQNFTDWTARGGKPGDFVRAYALGGMTPENQALMGVGQPTSQDTGSNIVFGIRGGPLSASPGQFTAATSMGKTLTPAEGAEFVTVTGADGKQYQVPKSTLFGAGGGGGGGGAPGAGAGGGGGGVAPTSSLGASSQADFIQKFTPIAQDISQRTGLPVNYVLAQAGLETGWGTSRAAGNNNFFGISPGGQLASYATPQAGADAYVALMQSPRYAQVPRTGSPAQIGTAMGAAGYNPNPSYGTSVGNFANALPAQPASQGGSTVAAGPGGGQGGAFIGATSAQPVGGGGAPVQPGAGSGQVHPAGGVQYLDPTGRPVVVQGSGGAPSLPGVARGPGGAPILTPPAPWMGPIWEQSAKEYSSDVSREAGLASRIQPWQSALSIIKANPNLSTGPTSQQWNNWGTVLSQYGVQLPSMPGDSVAAYQELSKSLHQGLVNSGAFSGTDMARLEAEASSPNMQQQVEAIRELSARQIGYERFQMARLKYFRSLHPGEDPDQSANQYRSQTSTWASNLDPVAFGADNLSPAEIKSYRQGLTPQQDDKFLRSLKAAHSLYPEITPGGQ